MFETVAAKTDGSTQRVCGFVMRAAGCGVEIWHEPTFPPEPRGDRLRDVRACLGVTLGGAARALGVSVTRVGELERGRQVFVDPADWGRAEHRLAEVAGRPPVTDAQLAEHRESVARNQAALLAPAAAVMGVEARTRS